MDVASNPKWKGQIVWRTPWTSGGGQHLYRFAKQVYGQEWIMKMQAQDPIFQNDQDAALLQVARGEYAIGLALTGRTASQMIRDGQPIAALWPEDFVIKSSNASTLMRGAPHPNAGKVFINWLLTERGQELWKVLGQFPLRADIAPADPWMHGVTRAKQGFENLSTPDEETASQQAATKDFKK
jgi:ABC-type Fe3+ transport system substrate-binding protein